MTTTTALVLGYGEPEPRAFLNTNPNGPAIGGVYLDGHALTVQATDPSVLFRVADQFAKAAHGLRAALAAQPEPIGGAQCPCGSSVEFYSDADRENWYELHDDCDPGEALAPTVLLAAGAE